MAQSEASKSKKTSAAKPRKKPAVKEASPKPKAKAKPAATASAARPKKAAPSLPAKPAARAKPEPVVAAASPKVEAPAPVAKPKPKAVINKTYPQKFESFDDAQLEPDLLNHLQKSNFGKPNAFQKQFLSHALQNQSIVATSGSGSGKLAAFMIYIAEKILTGAFPKGEANAPSALIAVSSRDQISKVQSGAQRQLSPLNISHVTFSGEGQKLAAQLAQPYDVVIASLDAVHDILEQKLIDTSKLKCVILDEIDEALHGHPEKAFYAENIFPRLVNLDAQMIVIQTIYSKKLENLFAKTHQTKKFATVEGNIFGYENLNHVLYAVPSEKKFNLLLGMLQKNNQPTIVFANTKLVGEWILFKLIGNNIKADIFWPHRDDERINTIGIDKLKRKEIQVLIAGDEFAKNIAVNDLTTIINFDVPESAKNYLQRVKRLNRNASSLQSYVFVCEDYGYNMGKLEEQLKLTTKLSPLPTELLETKDISENPIDDQGRVKRVRFGAQSAEGEQRQQRPQMQQQPRPVAPQQTAAPSQTPPMQPQQTRPPQDGYQQRAPQQQAQGYQQQSGQYQQQRPQRSQAPYGDQRAKDAAAGIVEAAARAAAQKQQQAPTSSQPSHRDIGDVEITRVLDALEIKVDQIFDSIKKSVFNVLRSSLPILTEISKKVTKD